MKSSLMPNTAMGVQHRRGVPGATGGATVSMAVTDADTLYSSYRERLIEHLLVGEVLKELWLSGVSQVEVLRAEVDGAGYDVALECGSIVRHIQLKAARKGGKRASVGIHVKLAEKPSGCVVWVHFNPKTLELGPFLWFGGPPGKPLLWSGGKPLSLDEFKVGKHTKGDSAGHKAERPNIRLVSRGRFEPLNTIGELVVRLFGKSPRSRIRDADPEEQLVGAIIFGVDGFPKPEGPRRE